MDTARAGRESSQRTAYLGKTSELRSPWFPNPGSLPRWFLTLRRNTTLPEGFTNEVVKDPKEKTRPTRSEGPADVGRESPAPRPDLTVVRAGPASSRQRAHPHLLPARPASGKELVVQPLEWEEGGVQIGASQPAGPTSPYRDRSNEHL